MIIALGGLVRSLLGKEVVRSRRGQRISKQPHPNALRVGKDSNLS